MIYELISKALTKNRKQVGLMDISLNYKKYKETGNKQNTIICKMHPLFNKDKFLEDKFTEISEHIKQNYSYEDIV